MFVQWWVQIRDSRLKFPSGFHTLPGRTLAAIFVQEFSGPVPEHPVSSGSQDNIRGHLSAARLHPARHFGIKLLGARMIRLVQHLHGMSYVLGSGVKASAAEAKRSSSLARPGYGLDAGGEA